MKRKKIAILFLGDCFYDARTINMAISLDNNNSVTIVACFEKKFENSLYNKISFFKVNIMKTGFLKYWEYHRKVSFFLKNKHFDFVICGDMYSLSAASFNKKNNKIIYDSREIYSSLFAHTNKPVYRFLCGFYEKVFLKYVDSVIVTAKTDLFFLKKKYSNYTSLRWHVIYNYPSRFLTTTSKNLRKKFSIPKNNIILLYHGAIHRGRGLSPLIKLTASASHITSIIIGDGVEKKRFVDYANSTNARSRVFFISKVPYVELIKYAVSCDLGWCVISGENLSYRYALPNKLFEYLLAGLPVVSSPLINIKKIIYKHRVGCCVDYNNHKKQIIAINKLINNKKDASYYQKICSSLFTWEKQKNIFLEIFN